MFITFYLLCFADFSIDKTYHKTPLLLFLISFLLMSGGHENFAKMIDEAEVLEFPMVVKNTRGHRGVYELLLWNII